MSDYRMTPRLRPTKTFRRRTCACTRRFETCLKRTRTARTKHAKVPVFLIPECSKTHLVTVKVPNQKKTFKLVYDAGSENSYIDLEVANAWGLMDGRKPLVPHTESNTIDSNGNIHKSIRLTKVPIDILCPDGQWRPCHGALEVCLDRKVNKHGRLFGVSHMRTLRDSVRYVVDYQVCGRK